WVIKHLPEDALKKVLLNNIKVYPETDSLSSSRAKLYRVIDELSPADQLSVLSSALDGKHHVGSILIKKSGKLNRHLIAGVAQRIMQLILAPPELAARKDKKAQTIQPQTDETIENLEPVFLSTAKFASLFPAVPRDD